MDTMILEVFSTSDLLEVEAHLKNLSQIATIEETLNQVCDCSFLYFYRNLFPDFINSLYEKSLNSTRSNAQLILSAWSDPERILQHVRHVERDPLSDISTCLTAYRKFVLDVMNEEYIGRLCELIETDLRYGCMLCQ